MFKFSIIIGITILLTGCGKKISTEEVFSTSINNFNNLSNYDTNLSLDLSIDNNESTLVSVKMDSLQEVDNINKISILTNNSDISFLGFSNKEQTIDYIDYNENKQYNQEDDVYVFENLNASTNTSYIISNFLQNGIILSGEMSEYENNGVIYYAIPCNLNFNTLNTFYKGLNINSEQFSQINDMVSNLTEEDLQTLNSSNILVNYFVYKDSLLPARIIVDKESMKNFMTNISNIYSKSVEKQNDEESSEFSFNLDIDLTGICFNINNISLAFSNFDLEETLSIPEDIKLNSLEKNNISLENDNSNLLQDDNSFEIVEEENFEVEDSEEDLLEDDSLTEEIFFSIFDDFGFDLDDESIRFPLLFSDFIDLGFTIDSEIETEILSPGSYSVPIKHSYNEDYIYVTYMNISEEELPLSECVAFSIELDSLFLENNIINTSFGISFDSSIEDIINLLGNPSYKYAGEDTYVYTYEKDKSHYLELQIDKELDKVVYIKFINADI